MKVVSLTPTQCKLSGVKIYINIYMYINDLTRTLRGDKVSMLTHTYPHKPLRKIKVAICIHQVDTPLNVCP